MVNDRAYEGIKFSASKKIIGKLNKKQYWHYYTLL